MAKRTKKQLTIDGLLACGYEQTFRSSKYRTFAKLVPGTKVADSGGTWMVGGAGALRHTDGALSGSQSFTGRRIHKAFQYVGELGNRETLGAGKCMAIVAAHRLGKLLPTTGNDFVDPAPDAEVTHVGAAT